MILAIDPGNIESAYAIVSDAYEIESFGKVQNIQMLEVIHDLFQRRGRENEIVIEMVACYGMAVGKSVFDTCVWIGRFIQRAIDLGFKVEVIYRKEVKINLCNSMKAKDSNIRQALIDRFARFDFKSGKGTKTEQDWFYGFSKDVWSAYAVGVTYLDKVKRGEKE